MCTVHYSLQLSHAEMTSHMDAFSSAYMYVSLQHATNGHGWPRHARKRRTKDGWRSGVASLTHYGKRCDTTLLRGLLRRLILPTGVNMASLW